MMVMNGLNQRTKERLHSRGVNCLDVDAVMKQLEEFEDEPKASSVIKANILTGNKENRCFGCGKTGHIRRDC